MTRLSASTALECLTILCHKLYDPCFVIGDTNLPCRVLILKCGAVLNGSISDTNRSKKLFFDPANNYFNCRGSKCEWQVLKGSILEIALGRKLRETWYLVAQSEQAIQGKSTPLRTAPSLPVPRSMQQIVSPLLDSCLRASVPYMPLWGTSFA